MYTIAKRFSFSASHQLTGLYAFHPCMNLHGHNYEVEVVLQCKSLSKDGFVMDYRDLDPIKKWIDNTLDHKHLNDVIAGQPSAERIAAFIHDHVMVLLEDQDWNEDPIDLKAIRVSETGKTWAEYSE